MNNYSIKHLRCLASFLGIFICGGCFQSENPFYRESDIVTDKRFEGQFVGATSDSNSPPADSYVVKPAKNRHYNIRYSEGDTWADLDAVLFKCGTNLFLDIKRIADNGFKSQPAVGPSSGMELLHMGTAFGSHCVFRVRFAVEGIQISTGVHGNPLYAILQKHPNLKYKTNMQGQTIDPDHRIIANPTEELHALLLAEGGNQEVFGFKGTMIRRKE